jgi:hypothetical protein
MMEPPPLRVRYWAMDNPFFEAFDPEIVQDWTISCEILHFRKCQKPMARKSSHNDFRPSLIDVYSREIIRADENSVYVALSYVWCLCHTPGLVATGNGRG